MAPDGAAGAIPARARDAATVVLLRDGTDGPEVLLLGRSASAGFVPGAHVFPGGAVDPGDRLAARRVVGIGAEEANSLTGARLDGAAFWVAAVRECLEEAGVSPATSARGGPAADLGEWRAAVHRGEVDMHEVLAAADAFVDASAMRCVARWVTPVWAPRRFDTRFFVAELPPAAEVTHDGTEIVSHLWRRPADALEMAAAGEITMIMPTVRTLDALQAHADAAAAVRELTFGDPAEPLLPEMAEAPDGRRIALLASDPEGNGGFYDGDTGMPVS